MTSIYVGLPIRDRGHADSAFRLCEKRGDFLERSFKILDACEAGHWGGLWIRGVHLQWRYMGDPIMMSLYIFKWQLLLFFPFFFDQIWPDSLRANS